MGQLSRHNDTPFGRPTPAGLLAARGWPPSGHIFMTPELPPNYYLFSVPLIMKFTSGVVYSSIFLKCARKHMWKQKPYRSRSVRDLRWGREWLMKKPTKMYDTAPKSRKVDFLHRAFEKTAGIISYGYYRSITS